MRVRIFGKNGKLSTCYPHVIHISQNENNLHGLV